MTGFQKKLIRLLFIASAFACLILCLSVYDSVARRHAIVIGSKCNTEQDVLTEALAQLIQQKMGKKVIRTRLDGTLICFHSLLSKNIDCYIEYTGTALFDILKERSVPPDLFSYLKDRFSKRFGLTWLNPIGFVNQFCLIANADSGLTNVSDLESRPDLRCAFGAEFIPRLEYDLLCEGYDREWGRMQMDQALLYVGLIHGGVDVITGSTTDARLYGDTFIALEEDKKLFPQCDACILVSGETLQKFPRLEETCNLLSGKVDEEAMRRYNFLAEEGIPISEVAAQLLSDIL